MLLNIIYLLFGFGLLFYGAQFLVDGSSSIARKLRIPEIIIGLTIVSFGTSAPELIVGISAALKNVGDITIGNVIGSNIFNLLLVLGITGVIIPIKVNIDTLKKFIPFSVIVLLILLFMGNDNLIFHRDNIISRINGIILLILFILYVIYNIHLSNNTEFIETNEKNYNFFLSSVFLITGILMLSYGGDMVTNNAVEIARKMNVSEKLIAITVIALGTSLPELITSLIAVIKKKPDIAVGNIIGSNIFNILLIIGVSATIRPIVFNIQLNMDIIILGISTLLLILLIILDKKKYLNRVSSSIILLIFILYWTYAIIRG